MSTESFRVLLIEGSKQNEIYTDLIREVADCRVDVVGLGESSFDWVARSNYHLVVIDASAPAAVSSGNSVSPVVGLSGLRALDQVRRLSPMTSVILITENATVEEAVAAIRMGAEDYLKKPFDPEAFRLAVRRGLDRKVVFGENTGVTSFLSLLNCCQMVSASLDQGRIFQVVQSYFQRELQAAHSGFFTFNEAGEPTRATAGTVGVTGLPNSDSSTRSDFQASVDHGLEEVLDIAAHATNPFPKMSEAGESYRFIDRGALTPGLFVFRFPFPLGDNGNHFCVCLSPKRPAGIEAFEGRLRILRSQLELTGKNIDQYQGVQQLAYLDDATGLYNTRYLHYILDREIAQAKTSLKSFAILFIDADKFKGVNDQFGHLAGTRLLNELGVQLKKYVREKDTVFRYGGDEFVAVLTACDLATAKTVAERIRQAVEQSAFLEHEGIAVRFTVSIGVALFPDHAGSRLAVISAADHAMYAAKRTQRNTIFIAPIPGTTPPPTGAASE